MEFYQGRARDCSQFPFLVRNFTFEGLNVWHSFLDWWAGKLLSQARTGNIEDFQSQKIFKQRNEKFQNEMAAIFISYLYRCRECKFCCMINRPFYQIDCVLYGLRPRLYTHLMMPPTSFQMCLWDLLRWMTPAKLIVKFKERLFGEKGSSQGDKSLRPCWMLGEHGCKYAWGQRPTYCVLFLCRGLISHLTWADYRQYIMISLRYLAHLTWSMKEVRAELSSRQRKA
jgi:hypothetical protein